MKRLFKTLFIVLALLAPLKASAQFQFGPVAGYEYQFRYNYDKKKMSSFNGIYAGGQVAYTISSLFRLSSGLQYMCSFSDKTVAYYNLSKGDATMMEHSIELPLSCQMRFKLFKGRKTMFTVDAGPTGSLGLSSVMKTSTDLNGYLKEASYDLYATKLAQRWNLFVCGNVGLLFNEQLQVRVGYRFGSINVGNRDNRIKLHCVNIGVNYLF